MSQVRCRCPMCIRVAIIIVIVVIITTIIIIIIDIIVLLLLLILLLIIILLLLLLIIILLLLLIIIIILLFLIIRLLIIVIIIFVFFFYGSFVGRLLLFQCCRGCQLWFCFPYLLLGETNKWKACMALLTFLWWTLFRTINLATALLGFSQSPNFFLQIFFIARLRWYPSLTAFPWFAFSAWTTRNVAFRRKYSWNHRRRWLRWEHRPKPQGIFSKTSRL